MKCFTILTLYQAVSGRFQWLDTMSSSGQDSTLEDIYSNLLNDINLDISFKAPPSTHSMMDNMMNRNDDYFIDESPSSMFSFSSFPLFFGRNKPSDFGPIQSRQKPLFLRVESSQKQPVNDGHSASIFILERSNKVSGNTFRYSVKTDGNRNSIITETWSTPKMYLCDSKLCGRENGIEMMNIFDDLGQENGRKYMHLVPTSTIRPIEENEAEQQDMSNWYGLWMNSMRDRAKGCHHRMNRWFYGEEEGKEDGLGVVVLDDNDKELVLETQSVAQRENDNLMLIGMSAIICLIMICGLLYSFWRYLIERKENNKIDLCRYGK